MFGLLGTAPTLPDTGVDVAAWIPVVLTAVGVVILAAVGAYFGLKLISIGIGWAGRMLSRR